MMLLGFFLWLLIGLLLGLMGAGGSIITVPVLVYFFHIDASTAALYSLFIVGTTSLLGAFSYLKQGLVSRKVTVDFGLPSIIAVVITRMFIEPMFPETFFYVRGVAFTKEAFLMCLLSGTMFVASYYIICSKRGRRKKGVPVTDDYFMLVSRGIVVGILCGLVGVGGGFLIIPALLLFSKLDIKRAIGTSLTIIALQSTAGFLSGWRSYSINWAFILQISVITMSGVFIGSVLSKKVDGRKLKTGFGWLVAIAAFYIIVHEAVLKIL
ncbi:hypothetical protein A8C56_01465 [Niabella ginsenosidivorans]|uniref:Probable membrane transporter protein n=1 Tax=Niabella ginsenosidivorans TaxID=1176587 RepID=A0A1A9I8H5_9BACT|nr:sulfite exporter TauE/SafE family protein [Niabella ginsenosidivorans]ANH83635.1 hypothetical protein A8C56_01465 [Niabella ginsenosidivorans]